MQRIAIVGTTNYGWLSMQLLFKLPEQYVIIAAMELPGKETEGTAACRERGIPIYNDLDRMLTDLQGKCDVIYLPIPIPLHAKLATKCLKAGYNVYLEKPPVPTVQDYDELIKARDESGKRLAVCFQAIHSDTIQRLKQYISQGKFGKVKRIRSMACWPRPDAYYARTNWAGRIKTDAGWVLDGPLNNALAHCAAIELYLASSTPDRMAYPTTIQSELYHARDIESEDTNSIRVITDEEVEIIFNATHCSAELTPVSILLEAENASVEYFDFEKATITWADGRTEELSDSDDIRLVLYRRLAQSLEQGTPFYGELEVCRPFTVMVNGAFESPGQITQIPSEYTRREEKYDSMVTIVDGMDDLLIKAHAEGKLLSEVGAPWAKKSKIVNMTGYNQFPSRGFGEESTMKFSA
ncbi:MAG: Gfo/Idh/MocA family oxidoreductase [Armatimonadota bacterium]